MNQRSPVRPGCVVPTPWGLTLASWCVLTTLAGCATLPDARPTRGLYVDLRKAVELREGADWVSDELEVNEALESVL